MNVLQACVMCFCHTRACTHIHTHARIRMHGHTRVIIVHTKHTYCNKSVQDNVLSAAATKVTMPRQTFKNGKKGMSSPTVYD